VSKETGQTAATIVWNNCKKMFMRMYPEGKNRCFWVINNSCLKQIMDMNILVGTELDVSPRVKKNLEDIGVIDKVILYLKPSKKRKKSRV